MNIILATCVLLHIFVDLGSALSLDPGELIRLTTIITDLSYDFKSNQISLPTNRC